MTEHGDPNDRLVADTFEEAWTSAGALAAARAASSIRRRRAARVGAVCSLAGCLAVSLFLPAQRKPGGETRKPEPLPTVAVAAPVLEIISDRELLDLLKDRQFLASRDRDGKIREVIFLDARLESIEPALR
ncbi:MAG: hypothetical protein IAE82_03920 [Opitutaceae bacterium]|nr:hypothetical protein [Opitutaceae bacterium]